MYWPTELKTASLVWALHKLQQYTDHGNIKVFVDHQAIVQAFKDQGSAKGTRSERLTQWRLFLGKFRNGMEIVHIPGKSHLNADGLSRLHTHDQEPSGISADGPFQLEDIPEHTAPQPDPVALWSSATANRQHAIMSQDPVFGRVFRELIEQPTLKTFESFYLTDSILHYTDSDTEQICLPLDATWKADLVQFIPEFRRQITRLLAKDPVIKLIYHRILKKAKDTPER